MGTRNEISQIFLTRKLTAAAATDTTLSYGIGNAKERPWGSGASEACACPLCRVTQMALPRKVGPHSPSSMEVKKKEQRCADITGQRRDRVVKLLELKPPTAIHQLLIL